MSGRWHDATATAEAVRRKVVSASELIREALSEIAGGTAPGAFWDVDEQAALVAAERVDQRIERGEDPGRFAGVAFAVKDCIHVRGLATTGGIRSASRAEPRDATVVARLRRAGAIPLGKTALNPLGWSADSEPSGYPRCMNPRFPTLAAGGSSSGSAAAVAADITALGLGTDVAGSVRVPAAYCAIVGFKPTLRSVPSGGVMPIVPSFDLVGFLARSVRDCATAFAVVRANDGVEPDDGQLVVGALGDLFEQADAEVRAACEHALAALGAPLQVRHARLDWQPRGFGRVLSIDLTRVWGTRVKAAPATFTDDIRASVEYGDGQTPDAERAARKALARDRSAIAERLASYDVVASPTCPDTVPPASSSPSVARATAYTRIFSALGWPAFSLPVGHDRRGRPVALQLAAPHERLPALFAAAANVERVTTGPPPGSAWS